MDGWRVFLLVSPEIVRLHSPGTCAEVISMLGSPACGFSTWIVQAASLQCRSQAGETSYTAAGCDKSKTGSYLAT